LDTLKPGQALAAGQSLISKNAKYSLDLQGDGNLVIYRRKDGLPIWASGTSAGDVLSMQGDGNLVIYAGQVPTWASDTFTPGSWATITDAGELRIVKPEPAFVSVGGPDHNPLPGPTPGPGNEDVPGAKGQTRLFGSRSLGDDDGPKLYVGLSRFPWLWFWKFDRDRCLRELDGDRAAGFRYGRVLAQVGDPNNPNDYWAGRIVDPDWPDYQEQIASLTAAAAERGHLIEWTIFGKGGPYDQTSRRRDLVRRVAPVLQAGSLGVLFGEVMNEPNIGNTITDEELKDLAALAKSLSPVLPWATGAFWYEPEDGDPTDPGRYERALVRTQTNDVDIEHLDRDQSKSEEQDRPWRQGWDHGLTGRRWCDNEPIGPGSSVNSERRPTVLRSHRAVNFVCGAFGSCLHGRPGVRGDLKWEDEPAYFQAPKAVRFLPGNLTEGKPQNSNLNYPDRPFFLDDQFLRAKNGNTRGIVRAYSILTEGVYYTIPFGPVSPFELRAERNLSVQCVQQDVGGLLWERDVAAGERLAFDGSHADVLLISRPR
jgi:hypothetical protein